MGRYPNLQMNQPFLRIVDYSVAFGILGKGKLGPKKLADALIERIEPSSRSHCAGDYSKRGIRGIRIYVYTEMRFVLCTWLGEISSCSFLTVLPEPTWVLLNKFCK